MRAPQFKPKRTTWNVKSVALKKRRGLLRSTVQKKKKKKPSVFLSDANKTNQTNHSTTRCCKVCVCRCRCRLVCVCAGGRCVYRTQDVVL